MCLHMTGLDEKFCAHCNGFNSAAALKSRKDMSRIEKLKKCLKGIYESYPTRLGISFEKWLGIAQSFYRFDRETKTLISIAAGPTKEKIWEVANQTEAEIKTLRLIVYKEYDHWKRAGNLSWFKWYIEEVCDEKDNSETQRKVVSVHTTA